jgi:hypothetical protein
MPIQLRPEKVDNYVFCKVVAIGGKVSLFHKEPISECYAILKAEIRPNRKINNEERIFECRLNIHAREYESTGFKHYRRTILLNILSN